MGRKPGIFNAPRIVVVVVVFFSANSRTNSLKFQWIDVFTCNKSGVQNKPNAVNIVMILFYLFYHCNICSFLL